MVSEVQILRYTTDFNLNIRNFWSYLISRTLFSAFNFMYKTVTMMMINKIFTSIQPNCSLLFGSASFKHFCSCIAQLQSSRTILTSFAGISPWFITGFTDAEGCFRISIIKNQNYKISKESTLVSSKKVRGNLTTLPLSVRLYFQIELHRKDESILESIQSALGVGKIYRTRPDTSMLQISSFKDIPAVIDFFDKYPLITQKLADYLLFKQA